MKNIKCVISHRRHIWIKNIHSHNIHRNGYYSNCCDCANEYFFMMVFKCVIFYKISQKNSPYNHK